MRSWHDTRGDITDADLAELAVLSLPPSPAGSLDSKPPWQLQVHLALDHDWPTGRDHLLALAVRFRTEGSVHEQEQVLRYRIEAPYDFGWSWLSATGEASQAGSRPFGCELILTPRFPLDHYPDARALELEFNHEALGLRLHKFAPKGLGGEAWFAPGEDTPTDRVLRLEARVLREGQVLARGDLMDFRYQDGRILRPDRPKSATAFHLDGKPDFSHADLDFWDLERPTPPMTHFLEPGTSSYSDQVHRAWLAVDAERLYWFMESETDLIRAETTEPDSDFLGDDIMMLLIADPDAEIVRMIRVNAAGVLWHAIEVPQRDLSWNPELEVHTRRSERGWQMAMAIPWSTLGWHTPPASGTHLRLNVAAMRKIAPHRMAAWHFWDFPINPETDLAEVLVP